MNNPNVLAGVEPGNMTSSDDMTTFADTTSFNDLMSSNDMTMESADFLSHVKPSKKRKQPALGSEEISIEQIQIWLDPKTRQSDKRWEKGRQKLSEACRS